ncbi:MAG TPA: MFS transporter [Acidobacteriaceae bacterium]
MGSARVGRSQQASFAAALFLLFLAVLINYVDRGNLSIAAPLLRDEWRLSATSLGALFSAFFWAYTAMQFVNSWLTDRFDPCRSLALGFLVWSLATVFIGLSTSFIMLLSLRLLLGVGESVICPTSSQILARYLPEESRGFANGVVCGAMQCGSLVGTFGGGLLMARYGWRPVFVGVGVLSLLWLPAWRQWKPRAPQVSVPVIQGQIPVFGEILRQRSFWGTAAGHFCSNYVLYFMATWLPYYLVREQHLSMTAMSRVAALYFLAGGASCFGTGWVADWWMRHGGRVAVVRKTFMMTGGVLAGISLIALSVATQQTYLYGLLMTGIGGGMSSAGVFAFGQTLAGPEAAGRWAGLQNGFANFAGVICPALTGVLIERTGHFQAALSIAAAMSIAGGCAWVWMVQRVEPICWRSSMPLTEVA